MVDAFLFSKLLPILHELLVYLSLRIPTSSIKAIAKMNREPSNSPKIIELPKICDERGNLSFIENDGLLPFRLARTYWIYDVPGGEKRFGHAFHHQEEVIIALSGSFDVVVNDGKETRRYHMARSYYGLYVPNMMWRELDNFSTNSAALVLSSLPYSPEEYIRDFDEFKKLSAK